MDDEGTGSTSEAELGERVPTLSVYYWSDYGGFTTTQEQMMPVLLENLDQRLGVQAESSPGSVGSVLGALANDSEQARSWNTGLGWAVATVDRLDPQEIFNRFRVNWAGSNGFPNWWHYTDCEYTDLLVGQGTAETAADRRSQFMEMLGYFAEEAPVGDITQLSSNGSWRPEAVTMDGIGQAGIVRSNAAWAMNSEKQGDGKLVVGTDPVGTQTLDFLTYSASLPAGQWQQIIHSPVHRFDQNYDLKPLLGEVDKSAREVTINLFDDATFTNGDPITASDVKFTFEQIQRGIDAGAYPAGAIPPYEGGSPSEGITVVDEKTARFNFSEPFLPFAQTTLMRWGILHPPTFESAGAVESPQNPDFELPIVTSGPFEVTEHTPGEQVVVEARDNHPVYSPPQGIIWQAYRNEEAVIQALAGGEVDVSVENSPTNARRINNEIDNATAEIKGAHTTHQLWHVTSHPPFKFKEFRKAVNAIVNREEMIDIVFGGALDPEMEATFISQFHPFFPENPQEAGIEAQADDPTGSTEMARELLRAEGYRWDDEDRLHYPPDKDLTPVWPQGETPTVESFPCLEEYRE